MLKTCTGRMPGLLGTLLCVFFFGLPVFGQPPSPQTPGASSYTRLAEPEMAEAVALTGQQQETIAALLDARTKALAEAPPEQHDAVTQEFEEQLSAVLAPEQAAQWKQQIAEEQQPRLRFNFRFQQWSDVLEWLADQADLSLVLDAPPPGTFNYSDTREYTPTEAIDLVNGVLQTKGYTLIRRGRMMLLLRLTEPIPEGLVPRVDLEELKERGQFELVSVLFPIGNRNADDVFTEISPLLGPHGKAVPLPKTKQLLVTDMAGVMRSIGSLIESIPEPEQKKPAPPKPKEPEKPELVVHAVRSADPGAVLEILQALMPEPSARFVRDPKLDQINAYATPTQQEAVKKIIAQMESDNPPEKRPRLEVYAVDAPQIQNVLEMLRPLAPEATISPDPTGTQIVAWAVPRDHEIIHDSLEKLGQGASLGATRQLEVHRLETLRPDSIMPTLQSLVPRAQMQYDAQTRQLIAVATADDQQLIRATIKQLQSGGSGDNVTSLEVYRLPDAPAQSILASLRQLIPQAQLEWNEQMRALIAVGTDADQALIRKALEQLESSDAGWNDVRLEVHPLENMPPDSVLASLRKLVPRAQIEWNAPLSGLLVTGTVSDQETVRTTLARLLTEDTAPAEPRLEIYSVRSGTAPALQTLLTTLVPEARITVSSDNRRVLAIADARDQETIKKTIDRLQTAHSEQPQRRLEMYQVTPDQRKRFEAVFEGLASEMPGVRIMADADATELTIWAEPVEHQLIADILEKLQREVPPDEQRRLAAYPVRAGDPAKVHSLMTSLFPEPIRIELDEKSRRLLVWARPDEHARIRESLEAIDIEQPEAFQLQLKAHPVKKADLNLVVSLIQERLSDVVLHPDATAHTIVARATGRDHETIQQIIDELEAESAVVDRRVKVYAVRNGQWRELPQLLRNLVPEARVELDPITASLAAWGTPEEHELIRSTVEQLEAKDIERRDDELKAYSLEETGAAVAVQILSTAMPEARFAAGKDPSTLLAWASPDDHQRIDAAVKQMELESREEDDKRELKVYPLGRVDGQALLGMLDPSLKEDAQLLVNAERKSLLVWAKPDKQADIAAALQQLLEQVPEIPERVSEVYRFQRASRSVAQSVIATLVPTASVAVNAEGDSLVISALPSEHQRIEEIVQQLETERADGAARQIQVYPLGRADGQTLISLLDPALTQDAQIMWNPERESLLVWARPDKQAALKKAIEELLEAVPEIPERISKVYPLESIEPSTVQSIVATLVPTATMAVNARNRSLIVSALPAEHERIEQAMQEIEATGAARRGDELRVYTLEETGANVAMQILSTAMPDARFLVGNDPDMLLAWARPDDHQRIGAAVEQLESESRKEDKKKQLEVYPLGRADGQALLDMLDPSLKEDAQLLVNSERESLLVWALPDDQERIKAAVTQLLEQVPEIPERVSQVYRASGVDPATLQTVIATLVPAAQIAVNAQDGTLVVSALPDEHEKIASMVDAVRQDAERGPTTVEIYPLEQGDAASFGEILDTLYERQADKPRWSVDSRTRQLVVVATPEQHKTIAATIRQLEGHKKDLEVFQLRVLDPFAAQMAVERLFGTDNRDDGTGPVVESDFSTQQLFVRASAEQIEDIRRLLIKMGETELAMAVTASGKRFRVVPFEGDPDAALRAIQRVWPKLRPNAIEVVTPSAVIPSLNKARGRRQPPQERATSSPDETPPPDESPSPAPRGGDGPGTPPPQISDVAPGPGADAEVTSNDAPVSALPPIIVAPGTDSLTIASDDAEALEQFVALLRTLSNRDDTADGNFTIIPLRNADALFAAQLIDRLFENRGFSRRSRMDVVAVADERTNSVVVRGGRADRMVVQQLLEAIDDGELPNALTRHQPSVIPVKNIQATEIAEVLSEIYKTQLTAGGERSRIPVPGGVSKDVAAIIQQINAAQTGPLMTMGVDEATNSLIVLAPQPLIDEVRELVADLDRAAAEDPAQALRVVALKKTSAVRFENILNRALRGGRSRRRSR